MAKPKLRFPEFTDEWEEKQLKDFMVFKNGLNADKDKFGSGIKFISVMDILNNPFITYGVIRGNVDVDEKTLNNYSVTYGDVLFQRSSETREDAGKSNVYLDKENIATFGGFVIRGKKTGDYSPEFMNSLLKSPKVRKEITSKAQGAQHINVGQETLENVSIILPTVKEQKKVADFLSSIDDIIQVQEGKIVALEEQKRGMMQKLFNREVRFKADDGSEYPEWKKKFIRECCIYSSSAISAGMVLNDGKYELFDANGKIGYINECSNKPYISIIKDGAGVGRIRLLPEDTFCIGTMGLLYPVDTIDIKFLYYRLVQFDFRKYIVGGAIPHIYFKDYGVGEVYIPISSEQQKIADCLSAYDEAIQIKKDKLEVWKEIKKGLLQQMFV